MAPAAAVPPNVNVSRWLGNQAETTIAINPTNPANIVLLSNFDLAPGLFRGYSMDGGLSWTTGIIANGDALGFACCDPSAAFDEFGNLFLTYLRSQGPGLPVGISTDGGATFDLLANLEHKEKGNLPAYIRTDEGEQEEGHGFAPVDQPTVTAGEGTVWVTYKLFVRGNLLRASGAAVTGLGAVGPFGSGLPVPGSKAGTFDDIAVGPAGQAMVTYQDRIPTEGPSTIYVNVDPDGLGPLEFGPRVTVTDTNVGGFDYIGPQSFRSVDAEVGLAWDRTGGTNDGRVYIVYTDERRPESDDTNIFMRYSDDDGATWSDRIKVNDDATRNSQFLPRIALDQTTGHVAIAFHDARNDLGDGGPGDTDGERNTDSQFFVAFNSGPDGLSFGPNMQVSAGTSNARRSRNGVEYGDYIGLAFYGGILRPAWADNSNSTGDNPSGTLRRFDVYTAGVPG